MPLTYVTTDADVILFFLATDLLPGTLFYRTVSSYSSKPDHDNAFP